MRDRKNSIEIYLIFIFFFEKFEIQNKIKVIKSSPIDSNKETNDK